MFFSIAIEIVFLISSITTEALPLLNISSIPPLISTAMTVLFLIIRLVLQFLNSKSSPSFLPFFSCFFTPLLFLIVSSLLFLMEIIVLLFLNNNSSSPYSKYEQYSLLFLTTTTVLF